MATFDYETTADGNATRQVPCHVQPGRHPRVEHGPLPLPVQSPFLALAG